MATTHVRSVFLIQPHKAEFEDAFSLVKQAVESNGAILQSESTIPTTGFWQQNLLHTLEKAELIICDVSEPNPNVMYAIGYAHALHKPTILIQRVHTAIPFPVNDYNSFRYDDKDSFGTFSHLSGLVREALEDPKAYAARAHVDPTINHLFICYSHQDSDYLERLLIHLKPLEKQGLVRLWADTRLMAGDKWQHEIEKALEHSRIAILLVSADFLASDFIVDNELPPLLQHAENKGTQILPVIVKSCRFRRDKHLSAFQAANNPDRPIALLPWAEQEKEWDKVAATVERSLPTPP